MCITQHLSRLKDICHLSHRCTTRSRFLSMVSQSAVVKNWVSAANFDMEDFSPISRLLVYTIKRMGSSTDPCGTTLATWSHCESWLWSRSAVFFFSGKPYAYNDIVSFECRLKFAKGTKEGRREKRCEGRQEGEMKEHWREGKSKELPSGFGEI